MVFRVSGSIWMLASNATPSKPQSYRFPPGPLTGGFVSHVQHVKALGSLVNVIFFL